MEMYVWEDVLTDYTSGMICVLANSKKKALEILKKEHGENSFVYREALFSEVTEVTKDSEQKSYFVYGGG